VPLDHVDARAHDPGQGVDPHPRRERVGREGAPQVVDPRRLRDPGGLDRVRPLAAAEVV